MPAGPGARETVIPWVHGMKLTLWVVVVIALFFGGGFAFLSTWDIPAPTSQIEQVLPNEQFPR
ncbi:hypothetical protein [Nisaea sediminum]|uniref:hypothetical protein n=1 Tax=Nisaea sediminum TaxID=2775867 RepID=UPI001D034CDC|nr:hypothetical protein [Nisaea sediminum]